MTMMAGIFTDKMPFADVYIHGLVRDEQNRKMSKSAGNGIDPLLLIDRYGADALRYALIREVAGAGQDIRLDYDRKTDTSITVQSARNFANKLWNATRFALIHLGEEQSFFNGDLDEEELTPSDLWILSRLTRLNIETVERYQNYGLGEVAKGLYEFAWNDFCDWYVELIKRRLNCDDQATYEQLKDQKIARHVLSKVLCEMLVMLHPLMPHITEELWHGLTGFSENKFLALQSWPEQQKHFLNQELEQSFSNLFLAIRLVRNLRAEAGLKPSQKVPVWFVTANDDLAQMLHRSIVDIQILTSANEVKVFSPQVDSLKPTIKTLAAISGDLEVVLPIEGLVDIASLRLRLEKDLDKANNDIMTLSKRLKNPNFSQKAPPAIVEECKLKLIEAQTQSDLARKRILELE